MIGIWVRLSAISVIKKATIPTSAWIKSHKTHTGLTEVSKKANLEASEESKLQQIPYIYYLAQFAGLPIQVLINLDSEVNVI